MNSSGFYKFEDGELFYAQNEIISFEYILIASEKDTYQYPVDGWWWFNSEEEAKKFFV